MSQCRASLRRMALKVSVRREKSEPGDSKIETRDRSERSADDTSGRAEASQRESREVNEKG